MRDRSDAEPLSAAPKEGCEPPLLVGSLQVKVTRSCSRRDLYDFTHGRAFDPALRDELSRWGSIQGSIALWIVDAPGRYRITIAPATGRVVLLPRMEPTRVEQRAHATEFFEWLAARIEAQDRST